MKSILTALAVMAIAAAPTFADTVCKKCCKGDCAACCKDKGKACGTDCCKKESPSVTKTAQK